jgi:hypothetical protein
MKTLILFVAALFVTSTAQARADADEQLKNAFLTTSAFSCAIVSTDEMESDRLFMLGLNAGREFLHFNKTETALYPTIASKVPMIWSLMPGPTSDFILGRIFEHIQREIHREYSSDKEVWRLKKQRMYQTQNCRLLGKP